MQGCRLREILERNDSSFSSLHIVNIKYKLAVTTFKAVRNHTPDDLSGLLHEYMPGRSLRFSNSSLLAAPISSTVESGRVFRNAAPLVWNELPIELHTMLCINDFNKYLKTSCLFKEALLTCA